MMAWTREDCIPFSRNVPLDSSVLTLAQPATDAGAKRLCRASPCRLRAIQHRHPPVDHLINHRFGQLSGQRRHVCQWDPFPMLEPHAKLTNCVGDPGQPIGHGARALAMRRNSP